ncbi:hypothetical protein H072_712 [Dactylellina haptotyla CBS 200.50]|uniref:Uncharacterized protein n=1 Tax=Dactylellina haptotyla (strain CBS 200.50) TaxID=1284197 RepID=S8AWL6_DACHA|nr:hypothetical protein H072_712 [Dactylellina haptotyla CBS 200.50]
MHFSNFLIATAATFSGLSSAIITGISVPATIKPGDGFNLYINTANYIQSVDDIAIALGVAPGKGYPGSLGQVTDSFYLGPSQSNVLYRIPKWTSIPATIPKGNATYTAAVFSLYGAADAQTLTSYNVTVAIGDTTSTTYVTSSP